MTLGIMQPYFFPYLGYFDLINKSDNWIIFDTPQYIRHGWVNRNRILHPSSGWQYVIVPVKKHQRETPINEIEISYQENWQDRILGQLNHYKKNAPYYENTIEFLKSCFKKELLLLSEFNALILSKICNLLGIHFEIEIFSKMDLNLGHVENPGEWALKICQAKGADKYLNPPGGESIFDKNEYKSKNIDLVIQDFKNLTYPVKGYDFVPDLSIIDVLMWNKPEDIKNYLDKN